jgi:hypothetical protein
MASKSPAPIVPWDEAVKGVWTEPAKVEDIANLRSKFTLDHIAYVGSSNQCGCGFRHATFQQGGWPEEWYDEDRGYDGADELADHAALVSLLKQNFAADGTVELLGVWEGGLDEPIAHRSTISVAQLNDPRFHFRDRGLYTVELISEAVPVS